MSIWPLDSRAACRSLRATTGLLLGLFEALTQAVPTFPTDSGSLAFSEPGCTRVNVVAPNGRARFEAQCPIEIKVDAYVEA